jgi:hypothetical protein
MEHFEVVSEWYLSSEERRNIYMLKFLYNVFIWTNLHSFVTLTPHEGSSNSRLGFNFMVCALTKLRKKSFSHFVLNPWNNLYVKESESVYEFDSRTVNTLLIQEVMNLRTNCCFVSSINITLFFRSHLGTCYSIGKLVTKTVVTNQNEASYQYFMQSK